MLHRWPPSPASSLPEVDRHHGRLIRTDNGIDRLPHQLAVADRSIAIKADELDAALKAKKAGEAAALIKHIVAAFPKAPPAEQKVAIKSLGNAAACKTEATRHVAFEALAKLKVEGSSKYLKKWMTASGKKRLSDSFGG